MLNVTDQLGNQLRLSERPQRVVSLVPSQSELLWDLGLRQELVGITKFCIHPNVMFKNVPRIGGTKQLDLAKIRALKPDLIIGNKEENERSQIETLQKEFPVWMSDIYNFEDVFAMLRSMGRIFEKQETALALQTELQKSIGAVHSVFKKQRVAYFIWNDPYMFAGENTFIDHVLKHLGFDNALSGVQRYPELDIEALQELNPDLCFLSSEPFPFKEKHKMALESALPGAKVLIVDGEVFSWYGSRLLHLENYVEEQLVPSLEPDRFS